jgi:hypothetical protein
VTASAANTNAERVFINPLSVHMFTVISASSLARFQVEIGVPVAEVVSTELPPGAS